jgi:hypothetical protein
MPTLKRKNTDGNWEYIQVSGLDVSQLRDDVDLNTTALADITYNVKTLGAKGDGVTDDTQTIINAIASVNGRKLYFPKGVYLVSSTINFTCSIEFEDAVNTYFLPKAGVTISPVIRINNQAFKSFENLSVYCGARDTVNQDGILITGQTNRCYFSNLRADNLNGYGVKIDTVWDSHFEKIHVETCGSTTFSKEGVWIGSTSGDTANQNTFISVQTEKCFYYGLTVQDTAYSNRFIGIHAEWNTPTSGNFIRLGGYRNQYYGSGHLGANYEKVYVGGEDNIYHGIFFDSPTVEGTTEGNGTLHYITDCYMNDYNQLNGSNAQFTNCNIGGILTINGNTVMMLGGKINALTHTASGSTAGTNRFYNVIITSLTQGGSGANNLELHDCTIINNVTFTGTTIKLFGGECQGSVIFNFTHGSICKNTLFDSTLSLLGTNTQGFYTVKAYQCQVNGNVTIDNNNYSELHFCSVSGNVSGDNTSKLIKSYVTGTTGSVSLVA